MADLESSGVLVLGLDPGGQGRFGWCVADLSAGPRPVVRLAGTADHAAGAVSDIREHVGDLAKIVAAGIDSPLFWVADGDRRVDKTIRNAMRRAGATDVHGTVQQVNSLRGACLAQGIMAAHLLRREAPSLRITESHPKALLWLLGIACRDRPPAEICIDDCSSVVGCHLSALSEHQRDAALGAVAAAAMIRRIAGWRDLALDESEAFGQVSRVEYWMPVELPQCAGRGGPDGRTAEVEA